MLVQSGTIPTLIISTWHHFYCSFTQSGAGRRSLLICRRNKPFQRPKPIISAPKLAKCHCLPIVVYCGADARNTQRSLFRAVTIHLIRYSLKFWSRWKSRGWKCSSGIWIFAGFFFWMWFLVLSDSVQHIGVMLRGLQVENRVERFKILTLHNVGLRGL